MSTPAPRISVVCVIAPDERPHSHALAAEYAHTPDVELVLVDHGDLARPPLEVAGATVVRTAVLGLPAAFAAGVAAARGAYIAHRAPETVGVPGALTAAASALDAAPDAWLYVGSYQLVGADGTIVHAIDPEQDAEAPPPGFASGLVFRREAAVQLSRDVGLPVFIEAMRVARAEDALLFGGPTFRMPFDRFALDRFDHRRDLHLDRLADNTYTAPNPWMSVVICADSLESTRGTLERMCTQVMPRGSFDIVVADRSGSGDIAAQLDGASALAALRVVRTPGATRGAAINAAAATATGDALLLLADDATPFPDLVEQHARAQRSMAPREVVVLGTWETPAAELSRTLARVLDSTDLVPGRGGLVGGQFHGGAAVHSANLSIPAEVFRRVGGFDETMPEAHLDHDLGLRL
ncbi:MAG: glycosyltransferase, partial [Myxococcota bacterium]|nr:glycosyltransferase [Myxococcota bacterium]